MYPEYEEYLPEPTKLEVAMSEIEGKAIEFGYDPAVVKAWLESKSASWEELSKAQDQENVEKAQVDIQQAADYVKGIFDNFAIDLRSRQVEGQAEFEQNVDSYVTELKTQVESQALDNIANLENWFNNKFDQIDEAMTMPYDEMVSEEMPAEP